MLQIMAPAAGGVKKAGVLYTAAAKNKSGLEEKE